MGASVGDLEVLLVPVSDSSSKVVNSLANRLSSEALLSNSEVYEYPDWSSEFDRSEY